MKKKNNFIGIIALLVSLVIVVSCKKEKTEDPPIDTPTTNTTEQNKANLEKAGTDFVKQMEQMETNNGIEAAVEMGNCLDQDDFSDGVFNDKKGSISSNCIIFRLIRTIQKYATKQIPVTDIYKGMDHTSKSKNGLEDDYNQVKGIYDWSGDTAWVKRTTTSNNVTLNFPSTKNGTTNNASFTVTSFAAQTIMADGNSVDVPTSFNWNLKVDNNTVISFTYSCTYVNDRPSNLSSKLTVSPFIFELSVKCSTSNCAFSYSLSNASRLILGFSATANGNWSESNLDTYVYDKIDSTYNNGVWEIDTIEGDSVAFDKILYDANVSFTVMDVKLTGVVDFKNLYNTMNNIDNSTYPSDQKEQEAVAKAINDYLHICALNTSDNSVIANGEAYVTSENDTNYFWNEVTQQEEMEVHVDYYVDIRLVFPDGSKADIETYTDQGFKAFVDEINTFMNDLAVKYDFEYDPIEYDGKK